MKIAELAGKRVGIWGAGKEGLAMASLLLRRLPGQAMGMMADDAKSLEAAVGLGAGIVCHTGAVTLERLREFEVVIKSPGVSAYREEIVAAKASGVVFTSGTNIWFAENPGARTICITGSKGKSTTSSVTAHLLAEAGYRTIAAGNIGVPLVELLLDPRPVDAQVIELSSYQLQDFTGAPEVSVLLNLFPEHLDWHHGEANYFRDKCHILQLDRLDGPLAVLNRQDPNTQRHVPALGRTRYFNEPEGYHVRAGDIYRGAERVVGGADVPLIGEHNLVNVCAALTAVEAFGAGGAIPRAVAGLKSFRPLPHRLTPVGEREGVLFVDDSIATIPQAAAAAVRALGARPVTIIVGGYDRGLDQAQFARLLREVLPHAMVAVPETGRELFRLLGAGKETDGPVVRFAGDLAEAVRVAKELTPRGGVVLLSPGAPSYNAFKNFEERGFVFGELAGFADYRVRG